MRKYWYLLTLGLLALDQVAKLWVVRTLKPLTGGQELIPGVIGFHYAENTGAAFSALSGNTVLLAILSAALVVVVLLWLILGKNLSTACRVGLSLVAAGGIGNLIDRMARGYVVDFIELRFVHFAIFNIADVCITVGAGLVILALLLVRSEKNG